MAKVTGPQSFRSLELREMLFMSAESALKPTRNQFTQVFSSVSNSFGSHPNWAT